VREVERLEREAWSTWRLSCREREEAGGKKKKKNYIRLEIFYLYLEFVRVF
jgi:hypothetical protein